MKTKIGVWTLWAAGVACIFAGILLPKAMLLPLVFIGVALGAAAALWARRWAGKS